ncbi:MAG: mannose-1-phosphate guanylyltransferase [Flavobacteriales bacterium AspAUS03]
MNHYCVILAGGVGSRFWPVSTRAYPKQFYDILGVGRTLIQQTFVRVSELVSLENIFVITHEDYEYLVYEQLPELPKSNLLLEPFMMNTAPSIAYASFRIQLRNKNASILIVPSDHLITEEKQFYEILQWAFQKAVQGERLITLGIKPSRPDTGYGYMQFVSEDHSSPIKKVKTFVEKPSHEIAIEFLHSGDFLWNSGIFVWNVQTILNAFRKHLPEMYETFDRGKGKIGGEEEQIFIRSIFPTLQRISIDYGILEKVDNVYVIPSYFGWSDLGTWGILYDKIPKDASGNALMGKKVLFYEAKNNIVCLKGDKAAIIEGLNDYIVVGTSKALLICRKEKEQEIKRFVNDLKIERGEEFL